MQKRIIFSPVTRLSGLLSIEVFLDRNRVVDANVSSTMFRGFEWIMRNRHITDAVYLTQRVCGIFLWHMVPCWLSGGCHI